MKRQLHCRHYGRYVDDAFVVSADKDWLHHIIAQARLFLREELGLTLHEGKVRIDSARQGVEFLKRKIVALDAMVETMEKAETPKIEIAVKLRNSLNSFCGVLSHYCSYRLRRALWLGPCGQMFRRYGFFSCSLLR